MSAKDLTSKLLADEYDDSDSEDSEYDSDSKPKAKKSNTPKSKTTKGAKKNRRNPAPLDGREEEDTPRIVLDEGTEFEVIGGAGWKVLDKLSKSANMGGWRAGINGPTLPIVNAVTAFDSASTGKTILLGLGATAWDDRSEQTEALVNTHAMRKNNVVVHNVSKRDGGLQRLKVGGQVIKLDFTDAEKLLTLKIREPTGAELRDLTINWLTPRIPVDASELLKQSSRRRRGHVKPELTIEWERRLANAPEMIVAKTIEATTQLCVEPVEMENRESPRQHRKQRLLPLHPRRLEGRTDSDTFFASITSIRNYACAQVFFHLPSNFLFVRCMTREAHSHGAYQDHVREVGAPNMLLTDNAQTLIGNKWTKTSRDNVTKQVAIAPHNQQQNQAERKIRDLKARVVMCLRLASAPLSFWCYCLMWVVDCLNYLAVKSLNWQTPVGVLDGNTPDISVFRFAFYEPVWYYEPTARYPEPNFLAGRFVGFAWNHGDAFTYRIWTCPDESDHTKGRELIRNIVKPREPNPTSPSTLTDSSMLDFVIHPKSKKRKRANAKRRVPADTQVAFDLAPSGSTTPEEPGGFENESEMIVVESKDLDETTDDDTISRNGEEMDSRGTRTWTLMTRKALLNRHLKWLLRSMMSLSRNAR